LPLPRRWLWALLLCAASSAVAPSASAQRAVFLFRHAEKASQTEKDPVLSLAGEDRALRLTTFLRSVPVDAIYATHLKRTQLTAVPLSEVRNKKPVVLPADDVSGLVKLVRSLPPEAVVVIIGHSDTLPQIIAALGVKERVTIRDDQYGRVFLVTPSGSAGGSPSLLELSY
jgi:broad specificity phosphatase PhoE